MKYFNIILAAILIILSLVIFKFYSIPRAVLRENENVIFNGTVKQKYKENENDGFVRIENLKTNTVIHICIPISKKENLWQKIKVGDSIFKNKGEKVVIIRNREKFQFEFPNCLY